MAVCFSLHGKNLNFNWDTEEYLVIRKDYLNFREEVLKAFNDALDNSPYDADFPRFVQKNSYVAIVELYRKFAGYYVDAGIYTFSEKMLTADRDYQEIIEKYIRKMIERVSELIGNVDDFQSMEEERRAYRKASRTRIRGYGYGISGLVGASVTSGLINGATGMLHGLFNAVGDASTASKASQMRKDIYAKFDKEIRNSMGRIFDVEFEIVIKQLNIKTVLNAKNASIIRENVKSGVIPANVKEKALCQAIVEYPFDTELFLLYMDCVELNEQAEKEILAIAEHFMLIEVSDILKLRHSLAGFMFSKISNRDLMLSFIDAKVKEEYSGNEKLYNTVKILCMTQDEEFRVTLREIESEWLDRFIELVHKLRDIFSGALEEKISDQEFDEECINFLKARALFFEKYSDDILRAKDLNVVLPCEFLAKYRLSMDDGELNLYGISIFVLKNYDLFEPYRTEPWKVLLCGRDKESKEYVIVTFDEIVYRHPEYGEKHILCSEIKGVEDRFEGLTFKLEHGKDIIIPSDSVLYSRQTWIFKAIKSAYNLSHIEYINPRELRENTKKLRDEIVDTHFEEWTSMTCEADVIAHYETQLKETLNKKLHEYEQDLFGYVFDSLQIDKEVESYCWNIFELFRLNGFGFVGRQGWDAVGKPLEFFADKDSNYILGFLVVMGRVAEKIENVDIKAYFERIRDNIIKSSEEKIPQFKSIEEPYTVEKIVSLKHSLAFERERKKEVQESNTPITSYIGLAEIINIVNDSDSYGRGRLGKDSYFYVKGDNLTDNILENVLKSYGRELSLDKRNILLVLNDAIFTIGSKGFSLTEEGIYTSRKERWLWKNIKKIWLKDGEKICVDLKNGDTREIYKYDNADELLWTSSCRRDLMALINEKL